MGVGKDFYCWLGQLDFKLGQIGKLGQLDFKHIWLKQYICFIKANLLSSNCVISYLTQRHFHAEFKETCKRYNIYLSYTDMLCKPNYNIATMIYETFKPEL